MKLYLLTRPGKTGWDEYFSAVVVAKSAYEARRLHPDGEVWNINTPWTEHSTTWIRPADVVVEYLGVYKPHLKKPPTKGFVVENSFKGA